MTESEIVSKVRGLMNELGDQEPLSFLDGGTEVVTLDDYIKSVIADAVALVQRLSSRAVNPKVATIDAPLYKDTSTGLCIIALPVDYVRLTAFKLNGWARACTKAYTYDSEMYKRQQNSYTRSGKHRPIVIEGYRDGSRVLELYAGLPSPDFTVEQFVYEGAYDASAGLGSVQEDTPLALAICYLCASLVYDIFENRTTSEALRKTAVSFIENNEQTMAKS